MACPRVLVVDDEPKLRTMLQTMLQTKGFHVVTAATCPDALLALAAHQPDAVIMDLHLDESGAHWLGQRIRAASPAPILLMTGALLNPAEERAAREFACDILYKPFDMTTLLGAVHACLHPVSG